MKTARCQNDRFGRSFFKTAMPILTRRFDNLIGPPCHGVVADGPLFDNLRQVSYSGQGDALALAGVEMRGEIKVVPPTTEFRPWSKLVLYIFRLRRCVRFGDTTTAIVVTGMSGRWRVVPGKYFAIVGCMARTNFLIPACAPDIVRGWMRFFEGEADWRAPA